MGHVVDEFANMSEVPNVPFAIRVIDLRSMIHVENVASVTEGWGFNITDERAGRSFRSMRHTAKPRWPRGMFRRSLKKHSRSIRCRGGEPQAPTGPPMTLASQPPTLLPLQICKVRDDGSLSLA